MNIENILDSTSSTTTSQIDENLEYKSKTRKIRSFLNEKKKSIYNMDDATFDPEERERSQYETDDIDRDLDQDFFSQTAPGVSIKLSHLPFEGENAEGLKVCLSALGQGSYDWNRKKLVVDNMVDKIERTNEVAPSIKKELENFKKDARKIHTILKNKEAGQLIDANEKQEVLSFAEDFSEFILDFMQSMGLDNDSMGASGGKSNALRINNMIPVSFSSKDKTYYGILSSVSISSGDSMKNRGMIVWSTSGKNDDRAKKEWKKIIDDSSLANQYADRYKIGSIDLEGKGENLKVSARDISLLKSVGLTVLDDLGPKQEAREAYMSATRNFNSDKSDEQKEKIAFKWNEIMSTATFWDGIKKIF